MTIEEQPAEPIRLRRPFVYVRVRLFRGEMFEYMKELFEEEREGLLGDLEEARARGDQKDEMKIVTNLRHINSALRDVYDGEIDLMGPE